MVRTLAPRATLDGLTEAARSDTVFLPALATFAPAYWPLVGLLPVLDINGALLAALGAKERFRAAPPIAGVFASDPFLRAADLAEALLEAGIVEVINYPTIQLFGSETQAAFASVGYRAEAEFRLLLRLAERGLAPIACATSCAAADAALALGLRRLLLHPGLVEVAQDAFWAELAGHVAVEGGEPLAWRAPSLGQSSRPRRRIRL
jgi:predicted TIM-barrel enzyme